MATKITSNDVIKASILLEKILDLNNFQKDHQSVLLKIKANIL